MCVCVFVLAKVFWTDFSQGERSKPAHFGSGGIESLVYQSSVGHTSVHSANEAKNISGYRRAEISQWVNEEMLGLRWKASRKVEEVLSEVENIPMVYTFNPHVLF